MIACDTCCKKHAIREILKLYINYILSIISIKVEYIFDRSKFKQHS